MTTTIDGLLNKRVWVEQPKEGFRIAIDTVLLAGAVPAKAEDSVLDLGCGVGGAMLCLAARVPGVRVTGIEIQQKLADLCAKNSVRNGKEEDLAVLVADLATYRDEVPFDHVMANPPFHDSARHDVSPDLSKRQANTDEEGDLALWVLCAHDHLREGGSFSMIHRGDREEEVVEILKRLFGRIELRRILPGEAKPAKRILLRATKGVGEGEEIHLAPPLILHETGGAYSAEARSLLWDAAPMRF